MSRSGAPGRGAKRTRRPAEWELTRVTWRVHTGPEPASGRAPGLGKARRGRVGTAGGQRIRPAVTAATASISPGAARRPLPALYHKWAGTGWMSGPRPAAATVRSY
jgi:hypothetical protein